MTQPFPFLSFAFSMVQGWSWYLGNDFIFFLCSPVILLLHHHRPRAMWIAMVGTGLASMALTVRPNRMHVYIIFVTTHKVQRRFPPLCVLFYRTRETVEAQ